MRFYLGTHVTGWLFNQKLAGIPLFLSRRQLKLNPNRKRPWRKAVTRWCLDSGGFQELDLFGRWTIPAKQYIEESRIAYNQIGGLDWIAIQDWMCEPRIREKTGKTVEEHQRRTIDSYLELSTLAPELPWIPILQGWVFWQYLRHVELYDIAGIDLRQFSTVGVGSVCRRQGTQEASVIFKSLADEGIRIHGFGVKKAGIIQSAEHLVSADSAAWSYVARRRAYQNGKAVTYRLCHVTILTS